MGHAPQSFAKAASERIRSGLSPKTIKNSAALLAPTPNPARRVGDVSVVSRARCRSCVAISSARANQRRASARRVYFAEAVGVSRRPGRRAAQRAFTAGSRATLSCRIISTPPSAVFGVAVAWPASTDRAAASASIQSDLPATRRRRRSARFTSTTRYPARRPHAQGPRHSRRCLRCRTPGSARGSRPT